MTEKIGRITIDDSRYPGEDYYCDGAVEDELLQIVKEHPAEEYARIIEERRSWPILYHLSPLRENIVDWIPMEPDARVLEVGSGCGAITGALARKAGSVTCVDLSKKRSLINAYRHSACDNVTIHVGNFKDIEPDLPADFDYICLIGVFEYGQSYIGGETPFEDFLSILLRHLAPGGRVVIAIENKYGLKYFAGCREDHLGTYFSGIENYSSGGGVRTFSRRGLERIFQSCGVMRYGFYYPYPDYKFMTTLYSDAYLPGKGELSNNLRNFDRDRMVLFDEKSAFDGMVEDGLFPVFANSFVAVTGGEYDIKYVKYSNDRAREFAISTQIVRDREGVVRVRKLPFYEEAGEHVRGMEAAYEKLVERYRGGRLHINRCALTGEGDRVCAEFEYIEGAPLSELMDGCLEKEDLDGFYRYFEEYLERVGYHEDYPAADFDPIFSNILVSGEEWTLIDYEWTFGKQIGIKESAFRAVYCYLLEDERRSRLQLEVILEKLGISRREAEEYCGQEMDFQKFVTGRGASMAQLRELIGGRLLDPLRWIERYQDSGSVSRVQVYEDRGEGFCEEESYFVTEAYREETLIECSLEVDGDVRVLRIDPAMTPCAVRITDMSFNGEPVPLKNRRVLTCNGRIIRPAVRGGEEFRPTLVFSTDDPNINIDLQAAGWGSQARGEDDILYVRMEIVRISANMAQDMAGAVKKLI